MAGTTVGKLNALLTADASQFDSVLGGASTKLTSFASVGTNLLSSLGIGLGIGSAIAAIKESISQAEESYQVQQKLAAVLDATGHAAGFSADQILDYSDQLSRLTAIDDEAIASAATLMATFGNIRDEQFTGALSSAIDMAAVLGTDVSSAAHTLGKALANPAEAAGKLAKAGIVLSASQREAIKDMMLMNDVAGAQAVILEALQGKFGGAAEKMRSAWNGVGVEFHNAMEEFGRFGSTQKQGGFADKIAEYLRSWTRGFKIYSDMVGYAEDKVRSFISTAAKAVDPFGLVEKLEKLGQPQPVVPPQAMFGKRDVSELSAEQVAAISDLEVALQKQIDTFGMSANETKLWEIIQSKVPDTALETSIALVKQADAMAEAARAAKEMEAAQRAARVAIESTIRSLEDQNATLGMNADQAAVWRLQREGANDVEIAWARSLADANTALRKQLDELSSLQSTGAAEQFQEFMSDLDKLNGLFTDGILSIDAYNNAVDKLGDAFDKSIGDQIKQVHEITRTEAEKAAKEIEDLNKLLELGLPLEDYQRRLEQIRDDITGPIEDQLKRASAAEFNTAAGYSASLPTGQPAGDKRTHQLLQQTQQVLDAIRRAIENQQPVAIGAI